MTIPLIITVTIIYIKTKKNIKLNEGYTFIAFMFSIYFMTGGYLAIFLNYLSQNNTLSEKVVFNGVALFYSIIVSILLMKLTISNEVTKFEYTIKYGDQLSLSSKKIIDNGNEILVYKESDNSSKEFLLEIPKDKIDEISIIRIKNKLYGEKTKTVSSTLVGEIESQH